MNVGTYRQHFNKVYAQGSPRSLVIWYNLLIGESERRDIKIAFQ